MIVSVPALVSGVSHLKSDAQPCLTSSTQAILSRLVLEGTGCRQLGRAGAPSTLVSSLAFPCHPHSYPQLSCSFVFLHCIPFQIGHLNNQAQFVCPFYYFLCLPLPCFLQHWFSFICTCHIVFTVFHNPGPNISIETQLYSWLFLWAVVRTSRSEGWQVLCWWFVLDSTRHPQPESSQVCGFPWPPSWAVVDVTISQISTNSKVVQWPQPHS